MKRKVKRYDEGGVLRDRWGDPVRSGSGEPVRTRFADSQSKAETTSEDTSSDEPRRKISDYIKPSEPDSVAGAGARNLALEEEPAKKVSKQPVKKKVSKYEDTGAKIGSQGDFTFKSKSLGDEAKTLPGKVGDISKPVNLPGNPKAKDTYRTLSGGIARKSSDERMPGIGDYVAKGASKIGEALSNAKFGRALEDKHGTYRDLSGKLQTYSKGGKAKKMASGGKTSSASKRADGIAQRGKTRGKVF